MARLFAAIPDNDLPDIPNFNLCPTQSLPVVIADHGRRLRALRWGFLPSWYKSVNDGPLIINARADGIATKPAFREAVRARRCIVPVSGFYEWSAGADGVRLPWYVTRTDTAEMALAAIWQHWPPSREVPDGGAQDGGASDDGGEQDACALDACAILTTDAGPGLAHIHHREPVVLDRADWPLWLGEAGHGAATLMQPRSAGVLRAHRVGRAVNANRATGPGLIDPFDE
tara:strand:- start:4173 stop:4859 length:687 start_codon:yes stop_codon:yes gene_type:complete